MTKSIELVINFETGEKKTFNQPEHIVGSAALEGLAIGKKMQKKGEENIEPSDIERVADFVTEKLYPGKFTREELIDGLHAPLMMTTLMDQLSSVFGDETENFTPGKKA